MIQRLHRVPCKGPPPARAAAIATHRSVLVTGMIEESALNAHETWELS